VGFFDEVKNPNPHRLVTFVDIDTSVSRVTVNRFETPWRVVGAGSGYGSPQISMVSTPRLEGFSAMRVKVRTGDPLSVISDDFQPTINLANTETIRLFVRCDKTGLPMRLGIGEASAGENLLDIAAVATVNAYVEREISISHILTNDRDAISRIQLEIYGKPSAGKGTAFFFFDKCFAVSKSHFANHFQIRTEQLIPDLMIETEHASSFGHLMDDSYIMDQTSLMEIGGADLEVSSPVNISNFNYLFLQVRSSVAPQNVTFSFGQVDPFANKFVLPVATANTWLDKKITIVNVPKIDRLAVKFFSIKPNGDFDADFRLLRAGFYAIPNPIPQQRVFLEKLLDVDPIVQKLSPIQSKIHVAYTQARFDNSDGSFYTLRDAGEVLNRRIRFFTNFEHLPVSEDQTLFQGWINDESIDDLNYRIQVQDALSIGMFDLPANTTSLPTSYFQKAFSRPVPIVFGRARRYFPAPIGAINRVTVTIGATQYTAGQMRWYINDPAYGKAGGISTLYYRGLPVPSVASFVVGIWGPGIQQQSTVTGRNWSYDPASNLLITWGVPSRPEMISIDARGYKDDPVGTYTGTPSALIENPSDVYRFTLLKILGIDPAMIDFQSLDQARTLLQGYRVARAIVQRQNALHLLGGSFSRDGLAQNMMLYFFQSNTSGKIRVLGAQTPTAITISNRYYSTGKDSKIIRGTYKKRPQLDRIITRIEIDYDYAMASGTYAGGVQIVNPEAETLLKLQRPQVYKIIGRWIPGDVTCLHITYQGAAQATMSIIGEGTSPSYLIRVTSGNPNESFELNLEGATAQTLTKLKAAINSKANFVATLNPSIVSTMDSRGLRDIKNVSLATAKHIKYSYAKSIAAKYLDEYSGSRDMISWRSPWIGYGQELGTFVRVRSLAEPTSRIARIFQTRLDPLAGTVDFEAEAI
jgi:hypothetical protein